MDDYTLSPSAFDEISSPRLAVLTPRSLQRYTSGILAKGFGALGIDVVPLKDATWLLVLLPVHSPQDGNAQCSAQRVAEDLQDIEAIVELVTKRSRNTASGALPKLLVALRPGAASQRDFYYLSSKLIERFPKEYQTKVVTVGMKAPKGDGTITQETTIPHGFFSSAPPSLVRGRVIVGTHIRPGEEVLVEESIRSILAITAASVPGSMFGYIGGQISPHLSQEEVLEISRAQHPGIDFEVVDNYMMVSDAHRKRVIVVTPNAWEPDEYSVTIDLRYLPEGSSGWNHIESLHIRPSIVVAPESFIDEFLPARPSIPFLTPETPTLHESVAELIRSGGYKQLLSACEKHARELLPREIARRYVDLFRKGERRFAAGSRRSHRR